MYFCKGTGIVARREGSDVTKDTTTAAGNDPAQNRYVIHPHRARSNLFNVLVFLNSRSFNIFFEIYSNSRKLFRISSENKLPGGPLARAAVEEKVRDARAMALASTRTDAVHRRLTTDGRPYVFPPLN